MLGSVLQPTIISLSEQTYKYPFKSHEFVPFKLTHVMPEKLLLNAIAGQDAGLN